MSVATSGNGLHESADLKTLLSAVRRGAYIEQPFTKSVSRMIVLEE